MLRRLTGRDPETWTPVDEGAYSPTGRWVVRWAGGGSAFVKAEPVPYDEHGVAVEHLVYSAVRLPPLPELVAYDGSGLPRVLVTEDLSHARWGTPVTAADAVALRTALDVLRDVPAPAGLGPVGLPPRWAAFAAEPAPLLATGLLDAAWLDRHAGALAAAEAGADTAGDRLLHTDLWLQNWCRTERGAVLVDWAGSAHGDPMVMRAWGEAGVRAAAGPPGVVLAPGHAAWAAWAAGQTAWFLSREGPDVHPRLLETERREALAALRWACDELRLPYPKPGPALVGLGPWRP